MDWIVSGKPTTISLSYPYQLFWCMYMFDIHIEIRGEIPTNLSTDMSYNMGKKRCVANTLLRLGVVIK